MSHKPTIILDCDPGHDDAVAIAVAAQHCNLLGITTVCGNVPLALTQHNARITAQILELDVPVHAGADCPLVAPLRTAEFIHGESGLGGPVLPDLTYPLASESAVTFIIDTVMANQDVWLVPTGPLTNIALALRLEPRLKTQLAGISLMGGGAGFGNVTPSAEFNILVDPEAADIVFSSGVPILMSGLNLTHQFMIYPEDIARMRELNNRAGAFVADMMAFYSDRYAERFFGCAAGPLHDPCAVMALTHPELFTFEPRHVSIELNGTLTRGMTVVDERQVHTETLPNVSVGYHLDREAGLRVLIDTLARYP